MLALGIRYLHGIAAAAHGEHGRVEWPPHPARVFMAMVAAHYQTGADSAERAALLWLEALPELPEIHAPDAEPCSTVTHFVPVNDKAGPSQALMHSLPLTRDRQPRTFARASLASDTVVLHWPRAESAPATRAALAALCAKVTRIGHSTSLVQLWLADSVPSDLPRWIPDEARATHLLRITAGGTLDDLDRRFNGAAIERYLDLKLASDTAADDAATAARAQKVAKANGATKAELQTLKAATRAKEDAAKTAQGNLAAAFPQGEPARQRPHISTYAGYAKAADHPEPPPLASSVFSPHLVVFTLERKDGPYRTLDLPCTLALTDRWREAVASHANDCPPAAQSLLTGHAADRAPLQSAHVAFLALGFVGHPHADGRVPGLALALPEAMPADVRTDILRVAARVCAEPLKLGRLGAWRLAPLAMARPLETLRAATWTAHPAGATHWGTVTPIAYDQHPKAKVKSEYVAEATALVAAACERIGLPRPREVIITAVSPHLGAPPAHAYPRLRRKDGSERRHTHAILIFEQPIRGPILLGAGRYRGYGLCRPIET